MLLSVYLLYVYANSSIIVVKFHVHVYCECAFDISLSIWSYFMRCIVNIDYNTSYHAYKSVAILNSILFIICLL